MSIHEKARRLLGNGQVRHLTRDEIRHYEVKGDTGTYTVLISPHVALCSCPAQVRCSHIEAAAIHWNGHVSETRMWDARAVVRHEHEVAEGLEIINRLRRSHPPLGVDTQPRYVTEHDELGPVILDLVDGGVVERFALMSEALARCEALNRDVP